MYWAISELRLVKVYVLYSYSMNWPVLSAACMMLTAMGGSTQRRWPRLSSPFTRWWAQTRCRFRNTDLYLQLDVISSPNVKILVSDWAVPGQYLALIGCRLTSSTHPRGELTTSSGGWTSTATGSSPDRSYSVPSGALSSSMNFNYMKDPWNIYIVTYNTGVCERLPQRHEPAAAPGPRHAVSRYSVDSLQILS